MDWQTKLATRTSRMEASAVREILKVASSPGVISLAGGLPAAESFPLEIMGDLMATVIDRYGARVLQYDASEGFGPLREALVPLLAARGIAATADQVVVVSGSQGLLDGVAKILVSPGDVIAVEAPTYLGALQAFNPYEPTYVQVETDDLGIVPAALDAVLSAQPVKLVYLVPTFQNPTGRTIPLARRRQIAEIIRRRGVLLLEDDPYSDLRYRGEPVAPIKTLAPENVIYASTLSKTFSPGLRIGFCVAPEAISLWLVIARQGVDLHTNTLAQALAAEYLSGGHLEHQLPRILDLYRPRLEAMLGALEGHFPEGFRWTEPDGGMFTWVRGPEGLDTERLYARALERCVAFVPGKFFFVNQQDGLATLRMNFTAADPATIDHAVALLAEAITEELGLIG